MANYWEAFYISWNDYHEDPNDVSDTFKLHGGNDTALGRGGNDTFYDWSFWGDFGTDTGNDTIDAGSGTDTIYAGDGTNSYNGGTGVDTIKYQYSTSGVTVNLETGTATSYAGKGHDTLYNIENVVGTSYADTITGDDADNVLSGAGGNDTLSGDWGNDDLKGGAGADRLTGGARLDDFIYTSVSDSQNADGATDLITDFQSGFDHLDMTGVAGLTSFAGNIGNANGELAAGEVGFFYNSALNRTIVLANTDGDSFNEMRIEMSGNITLFPDDVLV